jgi:hypothetical protein
MTEVHWLDESQQRASRALMTTQEGLSEHLDRRLRRRSGLFEITK